jgi:hypothetical protein
VLYNFSGSVSDGYFPETGVMFDSTGAFRDGIAGAGIVSS